MTKSRKPAIHFIEKFKEFYFDEEDLVPLKSTFTPTGRLQTPL